MIQQSPSWVPIGRGEKVSFEEIHAPSRSQQHYGPQPRHGQNPSARQPMAGTGRRGIYVPWNITPPCKKSELLPFAPIRRDPEDSTLSDVSQAEKHKDMWNLNRTTNECRRQRETDSQT